MRNHAERVQLKAIMRRVAHFLKFTIFLTGALLLHGAMLIAQQRELDVSGKEMLDAVLLLDSSGSMRITDPKKLRLEGIELFSQLLSPEDRLGIISFDDTARTIRELNAFPPEERKTFGQQLSEIPDSGGFSNIKVAIEAAFEMLQKTGRPDASKIIVLFSDGKMETSSGDPTLLTVDLLEKVAYELKTKNIKVYSLAFSDKADKDLLSQLSAATGGVNWYTPDASKIHQSYADLILAIKKPQVLARSKKGFKLDSNVQEATFYINRESAEQVIELLSPSSQRITKEIPVDSIRWYSAQNFDVVTIQKPEAGDWQLLGVDPNDGYATMLTNLKLITDWPTSFHAGDTVSLKARLYDNEKPVVLPEMTASGQYAFQIASTDQITEPIIRELLVDDGTHGDEIADDGIFSRDVVLEEPGEYKVRIVAKAPTFERNQQIPFRVRPRIVSLKIEEPTDSAHSGVGGHSAEGSDGHGESHENEHGDTPHEAPTKLGNIVVELSSEADDYRNIEMTLVLTDEGELEKSPEHDEHITEHGGEASHGTSEHKAEQHVKKKILLPLKKISNKEYRASTEKLPAHQKYLMQAFLKAEKKGKVSVDAKSKELSYEKIEAVGTEVEFVTLEKGEAPPAKESPIIPILLLTILQGGAAYASIMMLKKALSGGSVTIPEMPPTDNLQKLLESYQSLLLESDIDLGDERFRILSEQSASPAEVQQQESTEEASS